MLLKPYPAALLFLCLQAGTLRTGDIVSCGACCGKVRSLTNSAGRPVGEAGPSIAVQLIGLNAVPNAGDEFQVGFVGSRSKFNFEDEMLKSLPVLST